MRELSLLLLRHHHPILHLSTKAHRSHIHNTSTHAHAHSHCIHLWSTHSRNLPTNGTLRIWRSSETLRSIFLSVHLRATHHLIVLLELLLLLHHNLLLLSLIHWLPWAHELLLLLSLLVGGITKSLILLVASLVHHILWWNPCSRRDRLTRLWWLLRRWSRLLWLWSLLLGLLWLLLI